MDVITRFEASGGPRTREELRAFLVEAVGVRLPAGAVVAGHTSPLDYLEHAFLGDTRLGRPPLPVGGVRDCVVWANRGGGKTYLGAVATMLDMVFKPGVEVRILAGSLEQAGRMHRHLADLFARPLLAGRVAGRITERRLRLRNGSGVELLAQSQASVRGTRVQKLRCDEVELFEERVWEAAQLTTRSEVRGGWLVHGAIECLSTLHRPAGLMSRLVGECGSGARRLFRWGVVDVLEKCGEGHRCRAGDGPPAGGVLARLPVLPPARDCPLLPECDGAAKRRADDESGHLGVSDALRMKARVAPPVWEAEMLCARVNRSDAVMPEFDAGVHVVRGSPWEGRPLRWFCGMDFGYRQPTVVLWGAADAGGTLWIVDERHETGVRLEEHCRAMRAAPWPRPEWVGADPAADGANRQTGRTDAQVLKRHGFTPRLLSLRVMEGVWMIRARLEPADGSPPRLFVHERCRRLVEALEKYHFPYDKPGAEEPAKDGPDHAVDALRYLVVNLDSARKAARRSYLAEP